MTTARRAVGTHACGGLLGLVLRSRVARRPTLPPRLRQLLGDDRANPLRPGDQRDGTGKIHRRRGL